MFFLVALAAAVVGAVLTYGIHELLKEWAGISQPMWVAAAVTFVGLIATLVLVRRVSLGFGWLDWIAGQTTAAGFWMVFAAFAAGAFTAAYLSKS